MLRNATTVRNLFAAAVVMLIVSVAPVAQSDIYHYLADDGTHHFTTHRMSGMELIEVIRAPGSSSSSTSSNRSSSDDDDDDDSGSSHSSRDYDAYDDIIREASEAFDVPFELIKAVIRAESAFNRRAVSRAGAQGLMQLMPGTAEFLGVDDSFDARQNIFGGTRYLRMMSDRYNGDINLVLSAYNAGPGNVDTTDGIPFQATRRYCRTVYRYYQEYLSQSQ